MVSRVEHPALWLVLWSRLLTSFAGGLSSLAYSVIAIRDLGGVEAGVFVAVMTAVGVLVGNFAGGLADFVRPPLVIVVTGGIGLITGMTAVAFVIFAWQSLPAWCTLAFLSGLAATAAARAETTAIVHIIDPDRLPNMFGLVAARSQIAAALAGMVSGLILSMNTAAPFVIDAAAWLIAGAFSLPLLARYPRRQTDPPPFSLRELMRGYGFVWRTPPVLAIVLVSALANMFLEGAGSIIEIDLIARGTNIVVVGLLGTATNAAALVGSVISGPVSRRLSVRQLFMIVLATLALVLIVCGVFDNVFVMMAALSCGVLLIPVLGVAAATALARLTPLNLQARVSGANAVVSLLASTASPGLAGAAYVATTRLFVLSIAAAGTLASALLSRFLVPSRIEDRV